MLHKKDHKWSWINEFLLSSMFYMFTNNKHQHFGIFLVVILSQEIALSPLCPLDLPLWPHLQLVGELLACKLMHVLGFVIVYEFTYPYELVLVCGFVHANSLCTWIWNHHSFCFKVSCVIFGSKLCDGMQQHTLQLLLLRWNCG
jgi:hypothetical protein